MANAATHSPTSSIANRTLWISVATLITRLLFFITSIITARILTAQDYGLIGMAATITTLFTTTSAIGIDNYLIYKQSLDPDEVKSAFVLNTVLAALLALALFALKGGIALLYHDPGVQDILAYAALFLFLNISGRVPRALLIKEMKQNIIAISETATNVLNFLLIVALAVSGFKYLSYVIALCVSQALFVGILFFKIRHQLGFSFKKDLVRNAAVYCKSYFPQTMISYLFSQSDYILGGIFLGSSLLGYYYFGFEKAFLIALLVQPIFSQVFFPLLSKIQDYPDALRQNFLNLQLSTHFLIFPIIFMMLVCSEEFLHLFYGNRWDSALFPFRLLLVNCFLKITFDLATTLFNAVGKPEQNLRHYLLITPIALIVLYLGVSQGGYIGLTVSAFIVQALSSLSMLYRVAYCFNWRISWLFVNIAKPTLLLLLTLPFVWLLKWYLVAVGASAAVILSLSTLLFGVLYLTLGRQLYPTLFTQYATALQQWLSKRLNSAQSDKTQQYKEA